METRCAEIVFVVKPRVALMKTLAEVVRAVREDAERARRAHARKHAARDLAGNLHAVGANLLESFDVVVQDDRGRRLVVGVGVGRFERPAAAGDAVVHGVLSSVRDGEVPGDARARVRAQLPPRRGDTVDARDTARTRRDSRRRRRGRALAVGATAVRVPPRCVHYTGPHTTASAW